MTLMAEPFTISIRMREPSPEAHGAMPCGGGGGGGGGCNAFPGLRPLVGGAPNGVLHTEHDSHVGARQA